MNEAAQVVEEEEDEDEGRDGLVPYGPDFTPATLGKTIGEDEVLPWLLARAISGPKAKLQAAIAETCLKHIKDAKNRRDMASHVVQALQNYQLMLVDEGEQISLTKVGEQIRSAAPKLRDEIFGRHILTSCNGYRLVETIHRLGFSNQQVTMERLCEELDRSATSKNLSTMKAWLERAGVMEPERRYAVRDARVDELLGRGATKLLGLDDRQVEFVLAARVKSVMEKGRVLEAADVKLLAESRREDVRLPSKGLASFARALVDQGLLIEEKKARAKGGTRFAFRLAGDGLKLTDDQVRNLVKQASAGMSLERLEHLEVALAGLATGNADQRGRYGEMVAVHSCLMLGLRVESWRTKTPVEIDLIAERTVGLAYQRWHIQVKNIGGDLDSDRVDREIGAAAGTGATHLLFVVPRGKITGPARAEIDAKNRLTHFHIYVLTADSLTPPLSVASLIRELRGQEASLSRIKRMEAERRERLS